MKTNIKKALLILSLLLLASLSPNLFVLSQAGVAKLSSLGVEILIPSIVILFTLVIASRVLHYYDIGRLTLNGIIAGLIATVALEIVRETGFRAGTMPGELPRLMGVLMLNQFASGPDIWSDLAGWSYHFWNGASFGIILSLLLGETKIWNGIAYGLLVGIGFMLSPVVKSFGIGLFGFDFKSGYEFASTVIIAHVAFGLILSLLLRRFNRGILPVWRRFRT